MRQEIPTEQGPTLRRGLLWIPLGCAWLLMLVTFTMPDRQEPQTFASLDLIALAKVGARLVTVVVLAPLIFGRWTSARRSVVARGLFPLALFACWALVSVSWSALQTVSIGQTASLISLLTVAAALAMLWRDSRDMSTILFALTIALLAISAVLMLIHLLAPGISGLDRHGWFGPAAGGVVHPTSAAATSSLGLILLVGARLASGWRWTKILLIPGTLVFVILLLLAFNRLSLMLTPFVVLLAVVTLRPRSRKVVSMVVAASVGALFLLQLTGALPLLEFLRRGQDAGVVLRLGGRVEMWQAMWSSFLESPLWGHGYFVTSKIGSIDIWDGPANHTAHNLILQILVSTGVVGTGLFLWGLTTSVRQVWRGPRYDAERSERSAVLALAGVWYLGWSLLNASFMGPIQPESVVFFGLLGIAVGGFPTDRDDR